MCYGNSYKGLDPLNKLVPCDRSTWLSTFRKVQSIKMSQPKIKVGIVGAGLSGLTVANGLLNDAEMRYDVQIYERDSIAFDSERGGYQIRIASNGLSALKRVSDTELWSLMREAWAGDASAAPAVVDPKEYKVRLELSKYKAYPPSRPVPRPNLRRALLQRPLVEERVHFGHKFERFEYLQDDQGVMVYFDQNRSAKFDILIAADGSNSQVSRQVGLNNKIKLNGWALIQARGTINSETRERLPEALRRCGSTMYLGGVDASGFASIYDSQYNPESGGERTWNLFWSILIPDTLADPMIAKAAGDSRMLTGMLADHLRSKLSYGEGLPVIISSATENLRTGLLTSSIKPQVNWREGVAASSRVILIGDAVHPMTPGRGQGANQALTDAANLVDLFQKADFTNQNFSESKLAVLVSTFDEEMINRAFEMVKKSEQVTNVDLTTTTGKSIAVALSVGMTVVGWAMTLLETLGLKDTSELDFDSL